MGGKKNMVEDSLYKESLYRTILRDHGRNSMRTNLKKKKKGYVFYTLTGVKGTLVLFVACIHDDFRTRQWLLRMLEGMCEPRHDRVFSALLLVRNFGHIPNRK